MARRDIYTAGRFIVSVRRAFPLFFFFLWRKLKYISRKPARFYCPIPRRVIQQYDRSAYRSRIDPNSRMRAASSRFVAIIVSAIFLNRRIRRFWNFQSFSYVRGFLLFRFMCDACPSLRVPRSSYILQGPLIHGTFYSFLGDMFYRNVPVSCVWSDEPDFYVIPRTRWKRLLRATRI